MLAQKRHTMHWNVKRCIRDTSPDQHSAGLRKHDQTKKYNCVTLQQRPEHAITSNRESNIQIEITRNRIVTPRQSHRNGERQKKRKRREKRFRSYALTPPRFANSVPSHHALVPRGNCTIGTNVVVTIPREQSIHHQGGRVRFTSVLHLLGASCRHDSLHSFLQSEHFARRGGLLGSLQHRPFCTSR